MAGAGRARESKDRLTRLLAIAMLVMLGSLLPGMTAAAADPDSTSGARQAEREASRLASAADAVVAAAAGAGRLDAEAPPAEAIDRLRHDLRVGQAHFRLRQAVRDEQVLIYDLAKRPDEVASSSRLLSSSRGGGLSASSTALEAAWRLTGVDDLTQVHPRYTHLYSAAEPMTNLAGYYRAAAARTGIDWSYLAAVNFIESDFGRVDGPSSAGALGPMQFIASTWSEYGAGGDIMSPHDSIEAAATLLARNGAPADYDRAVFRYNHDSDYVAAVKGYAAAMRSDPLWLTRLYYWSTYG